MVNPTGKHRPKKRHHGDGTIVKLTDAWRREPWVWKLRRTVNGRRVTLASCSGTSRADVEAKARLELARLDRPSSGLTMADLLDRWLAAKTGTVKDSSWGRHRSTVRTIRARFADLNADTANADEVRARLTGTAYQHNRALMVVRSAVQKALTERLIERDPTASIDDLVHVVREAPAIDWPTAAAILTRCAEDEWGAMVGLAMLTGLRRGELLALRWSAIRGGTMDIRYQIRRITPEFRDPNGPAVAARDPKSRKSRRVVPVTDLAAGFLAAQEKRQADARRSAKVWAENDLVFANGFGEPWHPNTATRRTEAILRELVPGMRLHDLRHAWETLLSSSGASERVRMGLAGHATSAQTLDYTHVIPDDAREAMAELSRRLAAV